MSTTVLFVEGLTRSANFYAALLGGELSDQSAISELDFDFREYASTYFGRVALRLQDAALSTWLAQV